MGKYRQEPPFCVQVEFAEGCNLFCNFCGLTSIRDQKEKKFKLMTYKTAERIAMSIAAQRWNSRIEFAQHGEPTMNPDFVGLVGEFRKYLPRNQLMMTTNGGGLLSDPVRLINDLFRAGLNVLALDWYDYVNIVPKIVEKIKDDFEILYYPDNLENSPHKRWPRGSRVIIVVRDISRSSKGNHATLSNHSGAAAPLVFHKQGKKCAKPFREMSIHYDGNVNACCQDWFRVMTPGNVFKETLESIWNGSVFQAMRRKLYHGQRDFPPCFGCNYVTYRNGLLPDQRGKLSLPKPTVADNELLRVAYSKPLTKPVSDLGKQTLRTWNEKVSGSSDEH